MRALLLKSLALATVVLFLLLGPTDSQVNSPQSGVSEACGVSGVDPVDPTKCLAGVGGSGVITGSGATGPPTVTAVNPSAGPLAGATPVIISGTNFQGVTTVAFGATPAASFIYIGSASISAVSPAGTGTVNVMVTTPLGTSAITVADQFTYSGAACSNSMDFTQSCNSQYIGAL
jgi:hypothetical protein